MNEKDLHWAKAMVDLELDGKRPKKTAVSRMQDKQQTFSESQTILSVEPLEPRRRTRSLNAPSPIQQFGPCGRIMKNSAMVMTIQDPASQRLTWYKPPLTVLVIKKVRDSSVLPPFVQLVTWLIEEKRMVVFVEASVLEDPALARDSKFQGVRDRLQTFRDGTDDLQDRIDFIVCLGGDGTLLYASLLFQQSVPPVMAFHLGSLGFLTPFEFDNFQEQVTNVLEGNSKSCYNAEPGMSPEIKTPKIAKQDASIVCDSKNRCKSNFECDSADSCCSEDSNRCERQFSVPLASSNVKQHRVQSSSDLQVNLSNQENFAKYNLGVESNLNYGADLPSNESILPDDENHHKLILAATKKCHAALTLRSRLRCIIIRKGEEGQPAKPPTNLLVLNEVVVDRGPSPYLSNIDLFIDGKHVTSVQGDGLIVSTPTGSTAYAVAAGASMIHPSVPAIMVTPICPHSLSFRPIVVPAGVELKIMANSEARSTAYVSFDGRNQQELRVGDSLRVTTSIYPVPSICAADQITDWFDSLAECLHWNVRKRQKHLDELSDLTHSSSNDTLDSLDRDS